MHSCWTCAIHLPPPAASPDPRDLDAEMRGRRAYATEHSSHQFLACLCGAALRRVP